VNVQHHVPAALTPGESPNTYWIWGLVGPRTTLDNTQREKFLAFTGIRSSGRPARCAVTVRTLLSLLDQEHFLTCPSIYIITYILVLLNASFK